VTPPHPVRETQEPPKLRAAQTSGSHGIRSCTLQLLCFEPSRRLVQANPAKLLNLNEKKVVNGFAWSHHNEPEVPIWYDRHGANNTAPFDFRAGGLRSTPPWAFTKKS